MMSDVFDSKTIREAGNMALKLNNLEEAIRLFTTALLMKDLTSKEKALLYCSRSNAYLKYAMKSGNTVRVSQKSALLDAEEVMKIRPTWWKGYFRAGQVHQFQEEWTLAIEFFEQALALNPDLEDVTNRRDECRYEQSLFHLETLHIPDFASSLLQKKIDALNKERGLNLNAEAIINSIHLMKSIDRKKRPNRKSDKCAKLLEEAVDAGLPEAMVVLGLLYMEGRGVLRNIQKAVSLFERAAQCEPKEDNECSSFADRENYGITQAQFEIAKCYHYGIGKAINYREARDFYQEASDGGHPGAAYQLGVLFIYGIGVNKCSEKAIEHWSLAASRGIYRKHKS